MKRVLILIALFLLPLISISANGNEAKIFMEASNSYNTGSYQKAITQYKQLIGTYPNTGELFYNLGNAYFKNGELGKSIFYYVKAKQQLPRHGDIKYNLKYARNQKIDKQKIKKNFFDILDIPFNGDELLVILTISSLFFWIMMGICYIKRSFILSTIRYIALVILILSGITQTIFMVGQKDIGVVIEEEASIFSTMGANSIKLFTLHAGSEFTVLDKKENWLLLTLGDNKKGWIPSDKAIF